jgi:hypothetical protein
MLGSRSGGSGIRTHGGITSTVFKTVAFVRSAIPPGYALPSSGRPLNDRSHCDRPPYLSASGAAVLSPRKRGD